MAVPHYIYLLLKMQGKTEVLNFCSNLKRSYDCDQEAIDYTLTTRVLGISTEVFAAAQQLPQFEIVILTKKSSQSSVKSTSDIGMKAIHLQEGDPSKIACHTWFRKGNGMHPICAPGSSFAHTVDVTREYPK
jgi:DNA-binding NarL/FixJ family response regulator